MTKILCVDNDRYLTDLLRYAFEREGFDVAIAHTGHDATRLVREKAPHLVTLDLDTVDDARRQVLPSLRMLSRAPIVALSTATGDEDIIAGFERGADDYVAKPFNMEVLVIRVKAVLRRAALVARPQEQQGPASVATAYHFRGAIFDVALNRIVCGDTCINLTPMQTRILHLLFLNEGQPVSAERILKHVWGESSESSLGLIRTHIRHMREKIALLPGHPRPIHTVPRFGYMVGHIDEGGAVATSWPC